MQQRALSLARPPCTHTRPGLEKTTQSAGSSLSYKEDFVLLKCHLGLLFVTQIATLVLCVLLVMRLLYKVVSAFSACFPYQSHTNSLHFER